MLVSSLSPSLPSVSEPDSSSSSTGGRGDFFLLGGGAAPPLRAFIWLDRGLALGSLLVQDARIASTVGGRWTYPARESSSGSEISSSSVGGSVSVCWFIWEEERGRKGKRGRGGGRGVVYHF